MIGNTVSYLLSIIKIGSRSLKSNIHVPTTKLNLQLVNLLYKKGFIRGFFFNSYRISIFLKYDSFLKPAIKNIKIISTNGRKINMSHKSLMNQPKNEGMLIINTTKGLITSSQALYGFKIGGEVLCKVI